MRSAQGGPDARYNWEGFLRPAALIDGPLKVKPNTARGANNCAKPALCEDLAAHARLKLPALASSGRSQHWPPPRDPGEAHEREARE
jgi:hypothetical protein